MRLYGSAPEVKSARHTLSVFGSAHAIVPVEPVWPNVASELPLPPAAVPTLNPKPRGVRPTRL